MAGHCLSTFSYNCLGRFRFTSINNLYSRAPIREKVAYLNNSVFNALDWILPIFKSTSLSKSSSQWSQYHIISNSSSLLTCRTTSKFQHFPLSGTLIPNFRFLILSVRPITSSLAFRIFPLHILWTLIFKHNSKPKCQDFSSLC